MKLIVTSLVAIIFVAAGSFAAVVLKTPSEASASQAEAGDDEYPEDDHGEEKKAKKGKSKSKTAEKSAKKGNSNDASMSKKSKGESKGKKGKSSKKSKAGGEVCDPMEGPGATFNEPFIHPEPIPPFPGLDSLQAPVGYSPRTTLGYNR